jgi:uncharacterized DUF497 family protein
MITWDESKRVNNLARHGIDLAFLVWTERHSAAHLISCRYADKTQTRRYFAEVQP